MKLPIQPDNLSAFLKGQSPPAAVLACADSRVAPKIRFDQGLGNLFVIRVALSTMLPEKNVRREVKKIRPSKPLLEKLVYKGTLEVVGAFYDLDTGKVEPIE